MEWLSASKLKKFRKCPYSLQEKFTENEATKFGTAVHAGIAEFMKQNEQYFTEYIKQARKLMVPTTKDPEAVAAIDFVKTLGIDRDAVITVESEDGEVKYFEKNFFEIPFTDKWGIRGAMDLVYVDESGNLNIVDWKTGMGKEDDDLQLAIYALCAWKKYGAFPTIKTSFVYVQQGVVQTSAWDAESLCSALAYLEGLAEEYLEEIIAKPKIGWKQTPHANCRYCSLKNECVQFNRQLQEPPKKEVYEIDASLENLPALLEAKAKIEAITKAGAFIEDLLKSKIETVLEDNGNKVVLNNRTIQLKEKVCSYEYDLPSIFVQAQQMAGKVPMEICKYNAGGAKIFAKSLTAEQKKQFDLIVNSNKVVKTKTKTIAVSISKEPVLQDNSGSEEE